MKREGVPSILHCIDTILQYIVIVTLWGYALFTILNKTSVLSTILTFTADFRYIRGETPLTSTKSVVLLIGGYIVSLPLLQSFMKGTKPLCLSKFMIVHNLFLMLASAVLSIGITYFIAKDVYSFGFHHAICSADSHDNPYLHLFYYINYLLKYYEFVDTYLIILKKRPLIFLHWYHHASTSIESGLRLVTVVLTYIQQNDYTPVQWVPILMNLIVK